MRRARLIVARRTIAAGAARRAIAARTVAAGGRRLGALGRGCPLGGSGHGRLTLRATDALRAVVARWLGRPRPAHHGREHGPLLVLRQRLGGDQAKAELGQNRRQRIALDAEAAQDLGWQWGGGAACQVAEFGRHTLRHIQAQQHGAGLHPAHHRREAGGPGERHHAIGRNGNQARRRQIGCRHLEAQRPDLRAQRHGARLQSLGHIKCKTAGADADALEFRPQLLADLVARVAGLETQRLAQLEGGAPQRVVLARLGLDRADRGQVLGEHPLDPAGEPRADALALRAVEELRGIHLDQWLARLAAHLEAGNLRTLPGDAVLRRQVKVFHLCDIECGDPAGDLLHQSAAGGTQDELLFLLAAFAQFGDEFEADDAPNLVALNHHLALPGDGGEKILLGVVEAADQMGGAAVHKAGGEALMQRVAHRILGRAGGFLLHARVPHPIGAGGDIGPDANGRKARHQRIEITLGAGAGGDLRGDPVGGQAAILAEMREDARHEARVGVVRQLAEIGDLAGLPQLGHTPARRGELADALLAGQQAQRDVVDGVMALGEARLGRGGAQAVKQGFDMGEIEVAIAPSQRLQGLEMMALNLLDHLLGQGRAFARHAKGAVAHAAAGAAGDLRRFLRGQLAGRMAVELVEAGKGDMVHIHVQPHADGIRRHEEIHLAVLVHLHLRVAGARAEATHHHGAAAAAAANGLGDGIDLGGGEGDDGAARRQPGKLHLAGIFQLGEAWARVDLHPRHQPLEQRADGLGPHEHGLDQAARMQQPVGENMAAIGVGAELDFIDREEFRLAVQRHRLDRAGEPFGVGRDDLFLTRDQRDVFLTLLRHHAVIVFARQKAQRKTNDSRGMREHALHREMGFSGVGGA